MPMFDRARLRLTLWYLAILAVIVFLLSFALYDLLATIIQQAEADTLDPALRRGVARFFARIASNQRALALEIAAIDLGVLILAALGAYVLAGRTLRPIQESMDRQQRFAAAGAAGHDGGGLVARTYPGGVPANPERRGGRSGAHGRADR